MCFIIVIFNCENYLYDAEEIKKFNVANEFSEADSIELKLKITRFYFFEFSPEQNLRFIIAVTLTF